MHNKCANIIVVPYRFPSVTTDSASDLFIVYLPSPNERENSMHICTDMYEHVFDIYLNLPTNFESSFPDSRTLAKCVRYYQSTVCRRKNRHLLCAFAPKLEWIERAHNISNAEYVVCLFCFCLFVLLRMQTCHAILCNSEI